MQVIKVRLIEGTGPAGEKFTKLQGEVTVELQEGSTVQAALVIAGYRVQGGILEDGLQVALNARLLDLYSQKMDTCLREGDEITVMLPFAGG